MTEGFNRMTKAPAPSGIGAFVSGGQPDRHREAPNRPKDRKTLGRG